GTLLEFSAAYHEIQSEASGRRAVKLEAAGDYASFTLKETSNAVVLRYCLPDGEAGGRTSSLLAVYVDGEKAGTILLSSKFAWIYNYADDWPGSNDSAAGLPCRFFDDVRFLFDCGLPEGTRIVFKKEDEDGWCVIDMAEFELIPAPLARPENSISITDFGAAADGRDCRDALNECFKSAKAEGKEIWIPEGIFTVAEGANFYVNGVTMRGAGMWYSALEGAAYFMVRGGGNRFSDFSILGDVTLRADYLAQCAFETAAGRGNIFENLWLEHVKCGFWVKGADGMIIRNCRVRNTFADGINLTGGSKNSVVENCDIRNTGDDGIALNSERNQDCVGNAVRNNMVRLPYHASGIAVYGGGDNVIESNAVYDIVAYGGGINVSSRFNPSPFHGTTVVKGNLLIRTGSSTSERGMNQGAIWLAAWEKGVNGIAFSGNRLVDSVCDGITFDGAGVFSEITFEGDRAEVAAGWGIRVFEGTSGGASFTGVKITGAAKGALNAGGGFTVSKGCGNNW
ncbi:MAG: right-handed parallel beta-helix repeat-containing protein, partial [Treponema sp.]|nr:right-handed parallel beta-helix repeat-containing protein [Treponema sp.]